MDPYSVLGVDYNASQEDIKLAYRRVAMQWHPDRNDNSAESRERFHQAAEAYKLLRDRGRTGDTEARRPENRQNEQAHDTGSATYDHGYGQGGQDQFADSTFWDAMLDYGIKLAQSGMAQDDIKGSLCLNGCPEKLARIIAEKAFNIHAHYAAPHGRNDSRKPGADQQSFKEEREDADLWRAFLGQRSWVLSGRDAIDYYLVVFREFRQTASGNPLSWVNCNRRLTKNLVFAIVLFASILAVVHFFPGKSPYKPIADQDMLQIPFLVLSLMIAWLLFRKLWLVSIAAAACYLGTLAYYDEAMPQALTTGLPAVLEVAAVCFAPFIVITLFANFLYYLKAQRLACRARALFPDNLDQGVWIRNRAGTTGAAPFLFLLLFGSLLAHQLPEAWDFSGSARYTRELDAESRTARIEEIREHVDEALVFFDIGEKHFHATPPDYLKAEMAYSTAADNGSLLAAYKLGYMFYTGVGGRQSDAEAFDYFRNSTQAPLAFQPHNLEITTRFLAESYNNLGIMYQGGYGTRRDLREAEKMFRRAAEFGSTRARQNIAQLRKSQTLASRKALAYPDYR